jgi:MSHA biogenesis protein MshN
VDGEFMSLINQMLQDLEQRNVSGVKAAPLSGEVRAVSIPQSRPWMLMGGLVVLVAALLAGGWRLFHAEKMPAPVVAAASDAKSPVTKPPVMGAEAPLPGPQQVAPPSPSTMPVPENDAQDSRYAGLDTHLGTVPAMKAMAAGDAQIKAPATVVAAQSSASVENASTPPVDAPSSQAKGAAKSSGALKRVTPGQQSDNDYRQAVIMLQQGRVVEAQDLLRKSLEENPRNLKARQTLVALVVEGNHPDEAMTLLKDGLALSPEQTGFSLALARLQLDAGDEKSAMAILEQGLDSAGNDPEYHAFYAALLQREDRHDEAVQHYLVALNSNPAMPNWLVGIGISLQRVGKSNDAIAAFQRARDTKQLTPQLSQFVDQRLRQLGVLR